MILGIKVVHGQTATKYPNLAFFRHLCTTLVCMIKCDKAFTLLYCSVKVTEKVEARRIS